MPDRGERPSQPIVDSDPWWEALQWVSLEYYLRETNRQNGLVADKSAPGSPSSITAVGMALATAPVVVEQRNLSREEIARRVLIILRFLPPEPARARARRDRLQGVLLSLPRHADGPAGLAM